MNKTQHSGKYAQYTHPIRPSTCTIGSKPLIVSRSSFAMASSVVCMPLMIRSDVKREGHHQHKKKYPFDLIVDDDDMSLLKSLLKSHHRHLHSDKLSVLHVQYKVHKILAFWLLAERK